jgi:predicted small lipoprotein YifL
MQKITNWKRLLMTMIILTVLAACGQKGDLYLPEGSTLISSER